jgi:hypothetical protein
MNTKELQELKERVATCNARGIKTPKSINDKIFALSGLLSMPQNDFTAAQIRRNFETLKSLVTALEGKESKKDVAFVLGEKMLSPEALTKRAYSVIMKNYTIAQIKQDSERRIKELEAKRANQVAKIPLAQKSEFDKLINSLAANFQISDIVDSELESEE